LYKLFTAIMLILLAAACASSPPSSTLPNAASAQTAANNTLAVAQAQPNALPTSAAGEPLIARVNGAGITQADFEAALSQAQQQIAAADPAALQVAVLDTLIEQALIEQAAAAANVVISDEMLEAEFQASRALVSSDAEWEAWLAENEYTEAEFRADLRDALMVSAMRDYVTGSIPDNVLHVRARHILVDSEQAAMDVLNRLQYGEDFATLASSLSRDVTTREQGGDLGWFVEGELLEPVLTQVAFSLADGEIAGPIATRLGYHVIQKLGSEVRELGPERRAMLSQFRFEDWLRGLSYDAIIERYL
jgi:peptidyl-prolyl cis-trans isomerase C